MDGTKTAGVAQLIHYRNYRRARDRAMIRLTKEYPDLYQQYLLEERAKDEANGKNWVHTGSTVSVSVGVQSYKDASEGAVDPSDNGAHESYYGREE